MIKQKWIDALRSGEYKQVKCHLRIPGAGYCCLGVLCEVAKAEDEFDIPTEEPSTSFMKDFLPDLLTLKDGEFGEALEKYAVLIEMNDKMGKSFSEIADWIEENVDE